MTTQTPTQPQSHYLININNNNNTKEDDESYDGYEDEAEQHDAVRVALIQTPAYANNNIISTMLNTNLQHRYKNVQRGRDVIARKKKAIQEEEDQKERQNDTLRKLEKGNGGCGEV